MSNSREFTRTMVSGSGQYQYGDKCLVMYIGDESKEGAEQEMRELEKKGKKPELLKMTMCLVVVDQEYCNDKSNASKLIIKLMEQRDGIPDKAPLEMRFPPQMLELLGVTEHEMGMEESRKKRVDLMMAVAVGFMKLGMHPLLFTGEEQILKSKQIEGVEMILSSEVPEDRNIGNMLMEMAITPVVGEEKACAN